MVVNTNVNLPQFLRGQIPPSLFRKELLQHHLRWHNEVAKDDKGPTAHNATPPGNKVLLIGDY